jgi:uncharacterized protein
MSEIKHFFLKLNPPRASFTTDMTPEERAVMQAHALYWMPYVQDGTLLVLGPVADPKGGFGISVAAVTDKSVLDELVARDPANGLCRYEIYPMRAITKSTR